MRILVVEDHAGLGRFIAAALASGGFAAIGPLVDHASALAAVRRGGFDFAVIDWTLRGEEAFAIADALLACAIPFVLISGHPRSRLPRRYRELPLLEKPFGTSALLAAVEAVARGRPL